MAISSNLFKAILSMDAYNRGYDAGIEGLSETPNGTIKIGNATIVANSTLGLSPGAAQNIGFYALAYDTNNDGQADVISYRGTDDFDGITDYFTSKDVGNWTLGTGNYLAPQGTMALQFYNSVDY